MKLNEHKTGLSLGIFVGCLHLLWSILVVLGFAQVLLNWSMGWHMVNSTITVAPFSMTNALTLIIVSALVGYIVGYGFAVIWNKVHEK